MSMIVNFMYPRVRFFFYGHEPYTDSIWKWRKEALIRWFGGKKMHLKECVKLKVISTWA